MQSFNKALIYWIAIAVAAVFLWQYAGRRSQTAAPEITFSEFMRQVEQGNVAEVTIAGPRAHGTYREGKGSFRTRVPSNYPEMFTVLRQNQVEVRVADVEGTWENWLMSLTPVALLIGLWIFMIRRMQIARTPSPPPSTGPDSGFGRH